LLAAKIVGAQGQVHSFEPTPSTFEILQTNVKARANVRVSNLAIWSKETTITLNDYGFRGSAFNSLYDSRLDESIKRKLSLERRQVQAISVDDYVRNTGIAPNFIKIDAEIAEYEILCGMDKTLSAFSPIVTVEVGDVNTAGMPVAGAPSSKDIIHYLLKRDYQVFEFNQGNMVKHQLKERYQSDNLYFLPE